MGYKVNERSVRLERDVELRWIGLSTTHSRRVFNNTGQGWQSRNRATRQEAGNTLPHWLTGRSFGMFLEAQRAADHHE